MRSSHNLNIFRDPDPVRKPWFVGRMPSARDGRVLDFAAGYDQDGKPSMGATDRGRISESADPFFYLTVFGGTLAMSQKDMHECVEEMVCTRQEREKQIKRDIATSDQLKQKVADLVDAIKDAQVGRKRFAV